MKVAILTFARTNNNGATLQCYALNKYVQSLGHETIIINVPLDDGSIRPRKKTVITKRIFGFGLRKLKKIILRLTKDNRGLNDYEIRYALNSEDRQKEVYYSKRNMEIFDQFRSNYLPNITKEYFTVEDLENDYPEADAYVVGSDQVWNIGITKWQFPIFFLSFVKNNGRKISYAACMGGDDTITFSGEKKNKIKKFLYSFDHISVRNKMAVTICQNNFGFSPRQVLDPTFLIDTYEDLICDSDQNATGCLYVDKFVINDPWMAIIREIASREKLKIRMDKCLIPIKDIPYSPLCSIQDWLKIIKTSELIFTDSFHCIVFCILFRKQFVAAPSYSGGAGRMTDLLDKLGIEGHFYKTPTELLENFDVWNQPIDYDSVYNRIRKLKIESQDFLIQALK